MLTGNAALVWITAIIAAALVAANAILWRRDPRASAAVVLGIGWTAALVS